MSNTTYDLGRVGMNVRGEYNGTFRRYLEDRHMMPEIHEGDMELMKEGHPDFIGFNYYASKSISAFPTDEENQIGDIIIKLLPDKEAGIYQVVKNQNLSATLWGWCSFVPAPTGSTEPWTQAFPVNTQS